MVKIVELDGQFAGWRCTLRPQVSARILLDLESGNAARAMGAFAKLVLEHNFKGLDGEPIEDILDAPIDALTATVEKWAAGNNLDPK